MKSILLSFPFFFTTLLFSFSVKSQICSSMNIQHAADIPSTCQEITMTMLHDQTGAPFLYVAAKTGGLKIIDINQLDQPLEIASIPVSQLENLDVISLHQAGVFLYIALGNIFNDDQNSGMAIVDVSSPSTPVVLDVWVGNGMMGGSGIIRTDGNYAYLGAMGNGLLIFDISDKNNVVLLSQIVPDISFPSPNPDPPKYNARGMEVRDDLVYLCYDAGGLRIINVSDKSNPMQVGQYSNSTLNNLPRAYNNIAMKGNLAYVAIDYCGLEILDISDPSQITQVGWWNPWNCQSNPLNWFVSPGHTNEISFVEDCNLIFLSAGKSDLLVVDVSDPAMPDSCNFFGGVDNEIGTWGVSVFEDKIFLSYICAFIPFSSNWTGVKILTFNNNCVDAVSEKTSSAVSIYPNPSSSLINIESNGLELSKVAIFDALGRLVYSINDLNMEGTQQIDLSGFESGIYFLKGSDGGNYFTEKILVTTQN